MATTPGGTYYAASSELVSSWPATSLNLANQLESRFAAKANLASPTFTGTVNFSGATVTGIPLKVVQIVTGSTTTEATNNTSTFADTGLTATITPTSASNAVLVFASQNGLAKSADSSSGVQLKLLRGSTGITDFARAIGYGNTPITYLGGASIAYLDSPATTSAVTYKTQFANFNNTASVRVQADSGARSSIVLVEVTS